MKVSVRVCYGTRALLDVAVNGGQRPVSLKDISQREQISRLYLQQVIKPLTASGLLRSIRGARGGFCLSRPPTEVTLCDIVQILEGPFTPADCVTNPDVCARHESCVTRDIWVEIKTEVDEVLQSTTLQHLIERQKQRGSLRR